MKEENIEEVKKFTHSKNSVKIGGSAPLLGSGAEVAIAWENIKNEVTRKEAKKDAQSTEKKVYAPGTKQMYVIRTITVAIRKDGQETVATKEIVDLLKSSTGMDTSRVILEKERDNQIAIAKDKIGSKGITWSDHKKFGIDASTMDGSVEGEMWLSTSNGNNSADHWVRCLNVCVL